MDFTVREWMVIVGVLLIVVVLADALRRIIRERRVDARSKPANQDVAAVPATGRDIDLAWLKELPNGGARVVERRASESATGNARDGTIGTGDSASISRDAERPVATSHPAGPHPAGPHPQTSGQTKPAPPAPVSAEPMSASPPPVAPTEAAPVSAHARQPEYPAAEPRAADAELAKPSAPLAEKVIPDDVELMSGMSTSDDEPENLDWLDALDTPRDEPPEAPAKPPPGRLSREIKPEVFMLNVVARKPQGFRGDDILQILLACDLRFGDMNFFHRHEFEAGRGAIQFSVANMMQPGVFNIDNMADFSTHGLVFFVTLPGPEDMMKAFDYMLETARAVARNLDGDVLDETRSVLTKQTLEHSRQLIRDLERRLMTRTR